MNIPNDADRDVLRRMAEHGFDFSHPAVIDFNIDFDHWPLRSDEMEIIKTKFPNAVAIDPNAEDLKDGNAIGYVQFQLIDLVTYELVVSTQDIATDLTKRIGGICESWGVMQE
jgi:hypothetical protein